MPENADTVSPFPPPTTRFVAVCLFVLFLFSFDCVFLFFFAVQVLSGCIEGETHASRDEAGGDRKITTGITGLWQPSVHSDVAF